MKVMGKFRSICHVDRNWFSLFFVLSMKVVPIEILELECGLYCSLFPAVEPLRRTKMVDPRWQKTVVHYGVKGGFRCN